MDIQNLHTSWRSVKEPSCKRETDFYLFWAMLLRVLLTTSEFVSKPLRCVSLFNNHGYTYRRPLTYKSTVQGIHICFVLFIYHLCMYQKTDLLLVFALGSWEVTSRTLECPIWSSVLPGGFVHHTVLTMWFMGFGTHFINSELQRN